MDLLEKYLGEVRFQGSDSARTDSYTAPAKMTSKIKEYWKGGKGKSEKWIAKKLGISIDTVEELLAVEKRGK